MYIHRQQNWPRYYWNPDRLGGALAAIRHRQGRVVGHMEALGFRLRRDAVVETLTVDVTQSSAIEGETLDAAQVRSSIARRLGLDLGTADVPNRNVEGIVEIMLDATQNFAQPLTRERLFSWHAALFPTGRSGMGKITVGAWRLDEKGPMQVVSGAIGKEHVHFEAPAASRLELEMRAFLDWFEGTTDLDPVLKAALAHLWFVTIHPFDDGNGRVARALADMMLARSENTPQRFYSVSAQISRERAAYYEILEQTQKGSMDVTRWMEWFLACLDRAIGAAQTVLNAVLAKAGFWKQFQDVALNERQRAVLNRMLDDSASKLTTSNYAKQAKCSSDTALREILDLVEKGILVRNSAGGRSTSYSVAMTSPDILL